jgi:hypothetical protein
MGRACSTRMTEKNVYILVGKLRIEDRLGDLDTDKNILLK